MGFLYCQPSGAIPSKCEVRKVREGASGAGGVGEKEHLRSKA